MQVIRSGGRFLTVFDFPISSLLAVRQALGLCDLRFLLLHGPFIGAANKAHALWRTTFAFSSLVAPAVQIVVERQLSA